MGGAKRLRVRESSYLEHGRAIRLGNYSSRPEVARGGELVFVGFGIDAAVYGWNDLAGVDLRGKVAIGLLGEPASTS